MSVKLAVGITVPSLCRRTDDADIRHGFRQYFCKAVPDFIQDIFIRDDKDIAYRKDHGNT